MSLKRVAIAALLIVVLVPLIGVTVFIWQFNLNSYAPQIIAAVDKATGRQLTLGGPIGLALSLTPTVEVNNVSLSNPTGFQDPNLLTLDRIEARIALLPLLSHKIDILKLVLVGPNITLERNGASQDNWDMAPPPAGSPDAGATMPGEATEGGYKFALEAVEIQNGLITLKNIKAGSAATVALTDLAGTADSPAAPLKLDAHAVYNGTPFTLAGVVGPVERFSGVGSGPWPVDLSLNTNGASASVKGSIAEPGDAKGYNLKVGVNIPALEALASELPRSLLGGLALPAIQGITATAQVVDQNSTIPEIDNLSIKAGPSDLSTVRPGLMLNAADVEMASLDQAFSINMTGSISGTPLSLTANFGPLMALLNPAWLPASAAVKQGNFPVAVNLQAGDAKLAITGGIAAPTKLAGVALAITATAPDLSRLNGVFGEPLPAWKNISLQTTLIDPGGSGLMAAAGLDGTVFTMDNASLGGDASLYFGAQPRLQLAVTAQQLNLDPLIAAFPPATGSSQPPVSGATPVNPPATFIPDTKLPVDEMKKFSADIQVSADTVVFNNATYSAGQGHAVLQNGVLTINPLTAQLPGGGVSATAALDATQEPAAANLSISAPALALGPFLRALKLPDTAQGTMQVAMQMSGTGDSPHAIASTANGQLGLAMVNGVVDGSVLQGIFGTALSAVGLPQNLLGTQGPVAVRCFGLRVDAANGLGTIRALTMDSSSLLIQGGGNLDFGKETLGVIIRPDLLVVGNHVGVPVEIGGTFRQPTTSVATFGAVKAAAKTAVGLPVSVVETITGSNSIVGNLIGSLGLGESGDVCPAALSLGRLGKPGPSPAPQTKTSPTQTLISTPKNLLNSLLGN